MNDWKKAKLKDFFDEEELEDIQMIINNSDWKYLRQYLNERKDKLLKKGLLADYLYYWLEAEFRE